MVDALPTAITGEFLARRPAAGRARGIRHRDIACAGHALSGPTFHSAGRYVTCVLDEMALARLAFVSLAGHRSAFRLARGPICSGATEFAEPVAVTCVEGAR